MSTIISLNSTHSEAPKMRRDHYRKCLELIRFAETTEEALAAVSQRMSNARDVVFVRLSDDGNHIRVSLQNEAQLTTEYQFFLKRPTLINPPTLN